jgi:hypothetical protein
MQVRKEFRDWLGTMAVVIGLLARLAWMVVLGQAFGWLVAFAWSSL